jgi:hypothetical protein
MIELTYQNGCFKIALPSELSKRKTKSAELYFQLHVHCITFTLYVIAILFSAAWEMLGIWDFIDTLVEIILKMIYSVNEKGHIRYIVQYL